MEQTPFLPRKRARNTHCCHAEVLKCPLLSVNVLCGEESSYSITDSTDWLCQKSSKVTITNVAEGTLLTFFSDERIKNHSQALVRCQVKNSSRCTGDHHGSKFELCV